MANENLSIKEEKKKMRESLKALRKKIPSNQRNEGSQKIGQFLQDYLLSSMASNKVIAAFWPMAFEVNLIPLMENLIEKQYKIVLPVVEKTGAPLKFRFWQPGQELLQASYGQMEPNADAKEAKPDYIILPLLAFDRKGYRLGYGGGYYDRTIQSLRSEKRIQTIGVGFSMQEVDKVPIDSGDERLDRIVTEKEVLETSI